MNNHSGESVVKENKSNQFGAALLGMAVILLAVASLGVLAAARIGWLEQRVAGTELRAKEVYAVATGTMEYAGHWLRSNFLTLSWSDSDGDGDAEPGDNTFLPALPVIVLTADSYSRSVSYTLRSEINPAATSIPRIIDLEVTVRAIADNHIVKTLHSSVMLLTVDLFPRTSLQGPVQSNPPILVENCFGNSLSASNVFPLGGVSVGTTRGGVGNSCLAPGGMNLNGGAIAGLSPGRSLWAVVFAPDVTEGDLLTLQELLPERVIVVDENYLDASGQPSLADYWDKDVGTASAPVLLYFSMGFCTKIHPGTIVRGLVYYADEDCSTQEIGGGKIHGTLAKAGDLYSLSQDTQVAGTVLNYSQNQGGTQIDIGFALPTFFPLPGSWRDF